MIVTVDSSNFEAEVVNSEKPVLLDFWAPWCGPCQALAPVLEEIAAEESNVKIAKINVDESPELAANFGAMSIPLLVFMKDGAVEGKIMGAVPKAKILEMIG